MNIIRNNNSLPKSQNLSFLNDLKEQLITIIDEYKTFDELSKEQLSYDLISTINNMTECNATVRTRTVENRLSELESTVFDLVDRMINLEIGEYNWGKYDE